MNLKPEPQPFDELMKEYDEELLQQDAARQARYDALSDGEKAVLKQIHDDKVAAEMQPHRLDLSDEDE